MMRYLEKPIFVFAVGGRSASTLLQRILNSSGAICVWGEQHFIVDDLMEILRKLEYFSSDQSVGRHLKEFKSSFSNHRHIFPYANAIGNFSTFQQLLVDAFVSHLSPVADNITRFGFKDVRLKSTTTLEGLRRIFPDCYFTFLFRNPIFQWPSVKHYRFWDYADDLHLFLEEYSRISELMIDFSSKTDKCFFIEDLALSDMDVLTKLLGALELHSFDHRLPSLKAQKVLPYISNVDEEAEIYRSRAFSNYLSMKSVGF